MTFGADANRTSLNAAYLSIAALVQDTRDALAPGTLVGGFGLGMERLRLQTRRDVSANCRRLAPLPG